MADKGNKSGNKSFEQQLMESVSNVPVALMKRVNALKNIQLKMLDVESKFYEDLHLLECKYSTLFEPLYDKRKQLISGEYEPTEEEGKWVLDDDLDISAASEGGKKGESPSNELSKDIKSKVTLNEVGSGAVDVKGVPDFWLQTFKSVELISDMIQEHDEPVLKHLYDVRVRLHDQKPYGYTLEFHFNDNDFFANKVLTKTYELKTEYDQKDPFSYEGPDLYKCSGCTIEWKKGKNVTVRLVKKKQKHKGHGTVRVLTKEVKQDSFFNYFDTLTPPGESKSPASSGTEGDKKSLKSDKDHDEEGSVKDDEGLYAADFEIGHFFKERIIPKAVLYFTGEIADDDYDDYDEEDEEDDDDDDENDDDNEDDEDEEEEEQPKFDKKGGKGGKGGKPAGKGQAGGDGKNNPPECKQN